MTERTVGETAVLLFKRREDKDMVESNRREEGNGHGGGNGNGNGEGFWQRAAYKAAADINTVALYRLGMGVMGTLLLGLLTYFGSQSLSEIRALRADVTEAKATIQTLSVRIGSIEGRLDMEQRLRERMIDRINSNDTRLTILETKMMDMRR